MWKEFEARLLAAVAVEVPYPGRQHTEYLKSSVGTSRFSPAAVLILFGFGRTGEPSVLYIRRSDSVSLHRGQMAFPGGRVEDQDRGSFVSAALRETEEEVGIPTQRIKTLGILPDLITTTRFRIEPVVGILDSSWEDLPLTIDPGEIAEAVWIPFESLLHSDTYRQEYFAVGHVQYPIDVFQVMQYRIWGATGSITKNLLDRWNSLG